MSVAMDRKSILSWGLGDIQGVVTIEALRYRVLDNDVITNEHRVGYFLAVVDGRGMGDKSDRPLWSLLLLGYWRETREWTEAWVLQESSWTWFSLHFA